MADALTSSSQGGLDETNGIQTELGSQVVAMLQAMAHIEAESIAKHGSIRSLGFHRESDIRDFLPGWLDQEQAHARTIWAILGQTAEVDRPGFASGAASSRITDDANLGLRVAARLAPGSAAIYLVIGATAEYTARLVYSSLANHLAADSPDAARVLRSIARQEAGHLRFYFGAARLRLERSRMCAYITALVLPRVWSPVGVDALGLEVWHHTFAFLLNDGVFQQRLLGVDRLVQSLPGLSRLRLMEEFLNLHIAA